MAAVTEGKRRSTRGMLPPNASPTKPADYQAIQEYLSTMLLFNRLDPAIQESIVKQTYEIPLAAGEIIIREGATGLGANELYIVKSGEFEVLQLRRGVNVRVNMKGPGQVFGEVALMYDTPRTATVAATRDSVVWVLERDVFRKHAQEGNEAAVSQVEIFINSVPILSPLSKEEKLRLVDAFEEKVYEKGQPVITQGEAGDFFYIIKDGEAAVYVDVMEDEMASVLYNEARRRKKVNQLFKSDFFGEQALLSEGAVRTATVEASTPKLTVLALDRRTFSAVLGPLERVLQKEKSPEVVKQRLMKLAAGGGPTRIFSEVTIKRSRKSRSSGAQVVDIVRARGHLDEVLEMKPNISMDAEPILVLIEGEVLGGGAFSRVSVVAEESTGRKYALKRMRKSAVINCPDHVFNEQAITRNLAHPFCIRQYGSFQDKHHLYFLFDLMQGGDLMDILVAEARVDKFKSPSGFKQGCLAPVGKYLRGCSEPLARFYVASITISLEYLHSNGILYRDLKPENVFVDVQGYIKLGDFGFAKILPKGKRTYTFCGTPGYVAPENVLAQGYNEGVDWYGLGVLMYVLLTGRQPFSTPKTDDPMIIMRRIVDEAYQVFWPPYITPTAKDLIQKLMERKPGRRLGMLAGGASDIKRHKWFEGFDWDSLQARKMAAPRMPLPSDNAKRLKDQAASEENKPSPRDPPDVVDEYLKVFKDF